MQNDKYVVMKYDEFDEWQRQSNYWWMNQIRPAIQAAMVFDPPSIPDVLEDAVVIRKQDVFAGPGLSAYASAIQTVLEIGGVADTVRQRLEELRDFFYEQAQQAFLTEGKKIPD